MTYRDKYDNINNHYGKGLSNMNHRKNLDTYARSLVGAYSGYNTDGYQLFLADLTDSDQGDLVRLYLEYTGRDTGECVHGNDLSIDNDYTCALLAMLRDDCLENRERFARITRNNIIQYYKKSLQQVLDDACLSHENDINNENGFYAHVDEEHGDVVWR